MAGNYCKQKLSTYKKKIKVELQNGNIQSARDLWKKALKEDYKDHNRYILFADFELKLKNVNRAREILEEGIYLLPRVDLLRYKLIKLEEDIGNFPAARDCYFRWMGFHPDREVLYSFIKFELHHFNPEGARSVYRILVNSFPSVSEWSRFIDFERLHGSITSTRQCFEEAVETLEDGEKIEVYLSFADFEVCCEQYDRARLIYKTVLQQISEDRSEPVLKKFLKFEKQFGDTDDIGNAKYMLCKFKYEKVISKDPHNYDAWVEYLSFEENANDRLRTEGLYERGTAIIPVSQIKDKWKRYVELWIRYALYEEFITKDLERARLVLKSCLNTIPNKKFTFSKVWLHAADLELRNQDLGRARKILGRAIGQCAKKKIYRGYIAIERQNGERDRVRTLYQKYLEFAPDNTDGWLRFAEFEIECDEIERARGIFKLAHEQEVDDQESLIEAYLNFESVYG